MALPDYIYTLISFDVKRTTGAVTAGAPATTSRGQGWPVIDEGSRGRRLRRGDAGRKGASRRWWGERTLTRGSADNQVRVGCALLSAL